MFMNTKEQLLKRYTNIIDLSKCCLKYKSRDVKLQHMAMDAEKNMAIVKLSTGLVIIKHLNYFLEVVL